MNKVILVGRLTKDPEIRYTQNGKAVAAFTIAVNRFTGWPSQPDATDFIPIVTWERLAEICGNNLTKGRRILVEGRLQIRAYETTDGQKRRIAEVVATHVEFLDSKQNGAGQAGGHGGGLDCSSFGSDVTDDEIPF